MTSKPDRGWCITGRSGCVLGWTFDWTRRKAILKFMDAVWADPDEEKEMLRWRYERDHGCRCVRVEVREIGGEDV
jgi:hypothetical protein